MNGLCDLHGIDRVVRFDGRVACPECADEDAGSSITPGEWAATYDEYQGGYVIRSDADPSYSLARVVGQGSSDIHNARLIAAAAALLGACAEVFALLCDDARNGIITTNGDAAVHVLRAAINKAGPR